MSGDMYTCVGTGSYAPSRSVHALYRNVEPVKTRFCCPFCATVSEWRRDESSPKKCWACGAPRKS